MEKIENFAVLSEKERLAFATALVKTINSEKIFSNDVNFEINGIEPDNIFDELVIDIRHTEPVEVSRAATWTCGDADEATDDPGYDAEYHESIIADAKKAFKTLSAVIEGYKVTLDVADADADDTIDIEVDSISHEDAGIGSYEYWGHMEYDSRPYVEVEGTITKACECGLYLIVEPAEEVTDKVEFDPEPEEN